QLMFGRGSHCTHHLSNRERLCVLRTCVPDRVDVPPDSVPGAHSAHFFAHFLHGTFQDRMSLPFPESSMDVYELLERALKQFSHKEVGLALGVDPKTVRRWQIRETEPKPYIADAIRQRLLPLGEPSSDPGKFTFIDLFAGIGGIRAAFEQQGGRCVFTSEWDVYARKTYAANFHDGPDHVFATDITQVHEDDVPEHDVLLAGFPCQPFSIAGVSKKNALGRPHGFADKTQGTLFFDVARIIAKKKPRAFLLETVKNLVSHDKGRTFSTIIDVLRKELGYHFYLRTINSRHFLPQHGTVINIGRI